MWVLLDASMSCHSNSESIRNVSHTAKNAQVATSRLMSCNRLDQQADVRMRSIGLRQLVEYKSVASCQHADLLLVKTCYPQTCYKL